VGLNFGRRRSDAETTLDFAADEATQVEIQPEVGLPGSFKLYVHHQGRTIVRVCKLRATQIKLDPNVTAEVGRAEVEQYLREQGLAGND